MLVGLLISAPTIGIFTIALSSVEDILLSLQTDLAVSQLLIYLKNTLILCVGTALLSVSYSIPVAWCLAFYSFRGKRLIEILVILPMAMPAYILAYAYTDALDYSGWVANLISEYLVYLVFFSDMRDTNQIWPEIRSRVRFCNSRSRFWTSGNSLVRPNCRRRHTLTLLALRVGSRPLAISRRAQNLLTATARVICHSLKTTPRYRMRESRSPFSRNASSKNAASPMASLTLRLGASSTKMREMIPTFTVQGWHKPPHFLETFYHG